MVLGLLKALGDPTFQLAYSCILGHEGSSQLHSLGVNDKTLSLRKVLLYIYLSFILSIPSPFIILIDLK